MFLIIISSSKAFKCYISTDEWKYNNTVACLHVLKDYDVEIWEN